MHRHTRAQKHARPQTRTHKNTQAILSLQHSESPEEDSQLQRYMNDELVCHVSVMKPDEAPRVSGSHLGSSGT